MTRETRLVVVLFAVSIVGVTALAFMAEQYRKHLTPEGATPATSPARDFDNPSSLRPDVAPLPAAPESASARAARLAAGFIAAREAVQGLCAREGTKIREVAAAVAGDSEDVAGRRTGFGVDIVAAYRAERFDAFAAHGMTYADYVAARAAWRAWSGGTADGDAALAAAFETRKLAAEKAGLGELEALDDAIN